MCTIAFVFVLLISSSFAALTTTEINRLISLHNTARASASPSPATPLTALTWDTTIEADAQAWASQCVRAYSRKYYATIYGENAVISTPTLDVTTAFNYWMAQASSYNFKTAACSSPTCRNYVQIVAAQTSTFACASQQCSFGVFFVCDYRRYAQYSGVLPYTPSAVPVSSTSTTSAAATTTTIATITTAAATTTTSTAATTGKAATTATTAAATTTAKSSTSTSTTTAKSATTSTTSTTAKSTTSTTGSSATGIAKIDYRGTPSVVAIKDQGQCGSCWAFCATAIVEGAVGLLRNVSSLSDQDTLDCSAGGSCNGGWPSTALAGIIKQGGLNTQVSYAYRAAQGTCAHTSTVAGAITRQGTTKGDFTSMYNALRTYGPVGIAVNADNTWFSYRSGVISVNYTTVNHAVVIVGYEPSNHAWIIRNSWGTSWGTSGYAYLSAYAPSGAQLYGAFYAVGRA